MADQDEVVIVDATGAEHVFPGGFDPKRAAAIVRQQSAPKGDTYTGPDTFAEGFTQSLKQTAADTGAGILRGVAAAIDPRTYVAGAQASIDDGQRMREEVARTGRFPADRPEESGMTGVRNAVGSLRALSDPGIGGEAIGGLATGLILPHAVGGTKNLMKRGSLRAMQSALKPTDSLVKSRAGAGFPSKDAVAQAVLDEGRIVSQGSAARAQEALDATDTAALAKIRGGAGQGVLVDPYKVTAAIDSTATGQFGKQINAAPDTAAIQAVRESFATNPHVAAAAPVGGMAPLPADLAHEFATNTGRNLKGKFGRLGGATVEAEKAGREAITSQLRDQIPELGDLWNAEARQITTRDALEAALARRANTDPLGLSGIVGAVKNPALAVTALADRSALVKSMIAQGLNRGRGVVPSSAAVRAAVMAALAARRSEPTEDPERR